MKKICHLILCLALLLLVAACSPLRFVPEGESMLTDVRLTCTGEGVKSEDYRIYVRQEPNLRWLSTLKVPLGIYCLSGRNDSSALNRMWRRIGEAPVVYSDTLMRQSQMALQQALVSKGYLYAQVSVTKQTRRRRTRLHYALQAGERHRVVELAEEFDNDSIASMVRAEAAKSKLRLGMPLDLNVLAEERDRLVMALKNRGYVHVNNDFIRFTADTLQGAKNVRLTMHFRLPIGVDTAQAYVPYRVGRVAVVEDFADEGEPRSEHYRGLDFHYKGKRLLDKHVYFNNLFLQLGAIVSDRATKYSFENLNALSAVNFVNIRYATPTVGDSTLDAQVLVHLSAPYSVSFEVEGTNTAGDLGGALSFSLTHRNLFHASEQLTLKLRGAYEDITGLEGYGNQDYQAYSAEATLRFPSLLFPLNPERMKRFRSATDFSVQYALQNRPEFFRRVLTAALSYTYHAHRWPQWRNQVDLFSINYVYMPWISETFRKSYLESKEARYALLRSTYENLFIVSSSYGFTYTHLRNPAAQLYQNDGYLLRGNVELAGNLLYGVSRLLQLPTQADGRRKILGIPFAQYLKIDLDWARSVRLNEYASLAFHAAAGVGVAYGNASTLPYEKRYFSGGANSLRGWTVRSLGPGAYRGTDGTIDFIQQTGNVKIDLSMEYRSKLFWRFEGAAFVDAGNIWNTRSELANSATVFRLDRFWQQLALSYGVGLRLNLNFFILRFDGGMKAINPAYTGRLHYPLLHPNFGRDFALHFAVGLPF